MTVPAFAQDAAIASSAGQAGLDPAFTLTLRATAAALRASPPLLELATTAHHTLFGTATDPRPALAQLDRAAGGTADGIHRLFVLDVARLLEEKQRARGIPAEVTAGVVFRHVTVWLRQAQDETRAAAPSSTANPALPPGAPPDREWDPFWFRLVAAAALYRLGRLEFAPMRWPHPFRWFRHRTSGRTVLVAGDGVRFTADGYLTGDTTWTSACQGERGVVIAHPVRPTGTAERRQVRLPAGEWEQVLGPGDPVLDLHVPEDGGRLTLDVLHDALTRAERFFADFHPEHPFVAFFCASWLFGPFLPGLLGEDSGIVRWQREGYLSPDTGRAEGVLRWVFGSRSADPATAPGDTRLRAGVLRLLQDGAPLRQGRWLLARDDLHRFGTQPYRDSDRVIDDLLGPA